MGRTAKADGIGASRRSGDPILDTPTRIHNKNRNSATADYLQMTSCPHCGKSLDNGSSHWVTVSYDKAQLAEGYKQALSALDERTKTLPDSFSDTLKLDDVTAARIRDIVSKRSLLELCILAVGLFLSSVAIISIVL